MWPYCKNKTYALRETQCPRCGGPSTGWFEASELVMAECCPACREKGPQEDENGG
jgi:hypothetical protein